MKRGRLCEIIDKLKKKRKLTDVQLNKRSLEKRMQQQKTCERKRSDLANDLC